jgi:mono/diheme cytochrome c family protein
MRWRAALTASAAAAGLAGCGSGTAASHLDGRALFAQDCQVCHSLTGHPSPGQQGGDLLGLRMSRTAMLEFVEEMPVRRPLSPAELAAVADYVRAAEAGGR